MKVNKFELINANNPLETKVEIEHDDNAHYTQPLRVGTQNK